jgi:tetratricopeptide (TPR) repeat protein
LTGPADAERKTPRRRGALSLRAVADRDLPADEDAVRDELLAVLGSAAFAGASLQQRLLRHLVERQLEGGGDTLKETLLAIEVYQRPAGRFDPKNDSIVRVEARRLRERLAQHYAATTARAAGGVRIDLPKGSYKPRFVSAAAARGAAEAQAAELVERGQYFLRQGEEEGYRKALARFEQAAALAPGLVAAHSGVARAWTQLVATNIEPPLPGVTHALAAVRRALELAPRHADSLVQAAQLIQRFEFDWPAAEQLYRRALAVAPDSAFVLHAHGFALMVRGDHDAAEERFAKARRLDPLNLPARAHHALLQIYRGAWAEAEDTLRGMLDMSPDNVLGLSLFAFVALLRGDAAGALSLYRRVGELHPRLTIGQAGQAQALAVLGRADDARALMAAMREREGAAYVSPYQLAMIHERLGERAAALAELARAVEERDPNALTIPVDPTFAALRATADGALLARRVLGL